ncbi:MAG: helix-turn-helix transcriptional regulator [Acholeplasmataceae bacterium]|nr:helix-turn-helix transcriptional regulator [Acholeplasmataceae bacterium]
MKKLVSAKEIIKVIEKNDEVLSKWRKHYEVEKSIIEKMVEFRKNKGITQKELADKCGLKQSAIARIENRVNSPQLDTIIKIFDALDLKVEVIKSNQKIYDENIIQKYNFVFDQLVDKINQTIDLIHFKVQKHNFEKETNYENQKHHDSSRPNYFA